MAKRKVDVVFNAGHRIAFGLCRQARLSDSRHFFGKKLLRCRFQCLGDSVNDRQCGDFRAGLQQRPGRLGHAHRDRRLGLGPAQFQTTLAHVSLKQLVGIYVHAPHNKPRFMRWQDADRQRILEMVRKMRDQTANAAVELALTRLMREIEAGEADEFGPDIVR